MLLLKAFFCFFFWIRLMHFFFTLSLSLSLSVDLMRWCFGLAVVCLFAAAAAAETSQFSRVALVGRTSRPNSNTEPPVIRRWRNMDMMLAELNPDMRGRMLATLEQDICAGRSTHVAGSDWKPADLKGHSVFIEPADPNTRQTLCATPS